MSGEFEAVADVATGAIAARAVDGAGRSGEGADSGKCLNCGTDLIGPHMYRQLKGAYSLGRLAASWRMVALIVAAYSSALIFFIFLVVMGS